MNNLPQEFHELCRAIEAQDIHDIPRIVSGLSGLLSPKNRDIHDIFIRKTVQGNIPVLKLLLPLVDPKLNESQALTLAVRHNQIDTVRFLLPLSDPNADNNQAIFWAARSGFLDILRILVPFYDFQSYNVPLITAAQHGHLDCVKFLLPFSSLERGSGDAIYEASLNNKHDVACFLAEHETSEHVTRGLLAALRRGNIPLAKKLMPFASIYPSDGRPLSHAVESGDIDTVRFILPFVNPLTSHKHSNPLSDAVSLGHTDIFHLLLPLCDPKAEQSQALAYASIQKREDLFNILYPLSDPEEALIFMNTVTGGHDVNNMLYLRVQADQEKKFLMSGVDTRQDRALQKTPKKL